MKAIVPSGTQMQFAEAIGAYVASLKRGTRPSFSVGEWLNGLRDDQIAALGSLVESWRAADSSRVDDDIVGVALIAATAEGRAVTVASVAGLHDALNHLAVIVSFESLRRRGFIEIDNLPLSMDPHRQLQFRVTNLGDAAAQHVLTTDSSA